MPPVGPGDHVRGAGPEVVLYFDLGCPVCALGWAEISQLALRICARHFPISSRRPRSPALHAAAEAAARQREQAFWAMTDSIYADQGHQDDPHLWERARALELDLDRFENDRRSGAVAARIQADFDAGIRAGVTATPSLFYDGQPLAGELSSQLNALRSL